MRSKPTQAAKPHISKPPCAKFPALHVPILRVPALRISPYPKNPHRETQPCDTSWCAAGPIGPAEGPPPAMAGGGIRCLPEWCLLWEARGTVPGNGLARCLAGTVPAMAGTVSRRHDTGPPCPALRSQGRWWCRRPDGAGGWCAGHGQQCGAGQEWSRQSPARFRPGTVYGACHRRHGMWCPAERRHLNGTS